MKNSTQLRRETNLQVKLYKTHHARTTFASSEVEKVHAAVTSQNVQNTPFADHFGASARRCGEKHISKSKSKMSAVGTQHKQ